jgi:hypothetical protein
LLPSSGRFKLRVSKGQHADIQCCSDGTTHAYLLESNNLQLVSTDCYVINFLTEQQIYYASLPSQWPTEMNRCTWQ